MTDERGARWQELSSSCPAPSWELTQHRCTLCIHVPAGLQTAAAAGPGLEMGHLCSCCPGETAGRSLCPLTRALAPLRGLELLNQRLLAVSRSLVSPLGVHGFERGEAEQATDNGPTRGGGRGSREPGRLLPPSLTLVALAACKGLPHGSCPPCSSSWSTNSEPILHPCSGLSTQS